MSVHDLRRLFVLCAVLQRILANGSTGDLPISWQPKNPRHASCPTCPKDCPDLLSSPWYGKPVVEVSTPKRTDPDGKSESDDLRKWDEQRETLPYPMSPSERLSRQPADYKLLKHTGGPTVTLEGKYESGQNFDAAYFANSPRQAANERNMLIIPEQYSPVRKQPETEGKRQSEIFTTKSSSPDMTRDKPEEFRKILAELLEDERRKELDSAGRVKSHVDGNEADKVVTIALTNEEMHSLLAKGAIGGENDGMEYKNHRSQPFSLSQLYEKPSKRPVVVEEDMKIFIVDSEEGETDNYDTPRLSSFSPADRQDESKLQDRTSEEKLYVREEYPQSRGNFYGQRLNSKTDDNEDKRSAMYSAMTDNADNQHFATLYKDVSFAKDKELLLAGRKSPLPIQEQRSDESYLPKGSHDFPDDSAYFASRDLYAKLNDGQVSASTRPNVCQKLNPFDDEEIKEIGECFAPMTEKHAFNDENNGHAVQDQPTYTKGINIEDRKDHVAVDNPTPNIYEYLDSRELRNDRKDHQSEFDGPRSYNTFIPEEPATKIDARDTYTHDMNNLRKTERLGNNTHNESLNKNMHYNFRPQRAFNNVQEEIRYTNFPELMVEIEKKAIPQYKEGTRQNRLFHFAGNKETEKFDENDDYVSRFPVVNTKNLIEKNKDINMNVSQHMETAENKSMTETDTVHVPKSSAAHGNAKIFTETNTASFDKNHEEEILPNFDPDLLDEIEEPFEPTEPTSNGDFMETSTNI